VVAPFVTGRGSAELRDQLDRASASVVLNIAEGAGRWSWKDKRRFYAIARGSATETAAIVSLLSVSSVIDGDARARASELAARVVYDAHAALSEDRAMSFAIILATCAASDGASSCCARSLSRPRR
jgi:four helix bundle protein